MKELVFIQNEQALTTSLKVAAKFKKNHRHVLDSIRDLIKQIEGMPKIRHTPMFSESSYVNEQNGQTYPMYYMNRDGFTLLAMGFTGKKALEFKLDYIAAFNAMEQKIQQLLTERNSDEWKQIRQLTKESQRKLTDVIQQVLIPLAIKQGSKNYNHFYTHYSRMINKALGIKSDSRDDLSPELLFELNKMNDMAAVTIEKLAAEETDHHEIYKEIKRRIGFYAEMSMFNQRLLK